MNNTMNQYHCTLCYH